ncbi:MAG: hypothetical protein GF308_07105 [Candidatus Heimdallarchaeota archaeon]|nr:hypothetical protein [Candidatus Heimdallarchaeota archaeon]
MEDRNGLLMSSLDCLQCDTSLNINPFIVDNRKKDCRTVEKRILTTMVNYLSGNSQKPQQ